MGGLNHLPKKDLVFIALASTIFIVSTFLFLNYDSYFSRPLIHPEDVLGRVLSKSGSVLRKTPDQFQFLEILAQDPVGNGDAVFTQEGAQTIIELNDDSKIRIGPESLVVIRMKNGKYNIRIDRGDVSAEVTPGSTLEFQTKKRSLEVHGSGVKSLSLSLDSNENLELKDMKLAEKKPKKRGLSRQKEYSSSKQKVSTGPARVVAQEMPPETSKESILPKDSVRILSSREVPKVRKPEGPQLPYPANGSILMYKTAKKFQLVPKAKCYQACETKVWVDRQLVFTRTLEQDGEPIFLIDIDSQRKSRVKWEIRDGEGSVEKGSFQTMPFNKENFSRALKERKNIEVLD